MTPEQIELAVLALPKTSQAALLSRLLKHWGEDEEIDEVGKAWVEETEWRDRSMNENQSGIPAEEVFQKLRAALQ